jgi:hypothetical protein
MARINFVAEQVGDPSRPGVRAIIDRLKAHGSLSPERLVESCLDLLGPVQVGTDTRQELTAQAKEWGQVAWDSAANAKIADQRTAEMLQLIAATREYQFG